MVVDVGNDLGVCYIRVLQYNFLYPDLLYSIIITFCSYMAHDHFKKKMIKKLDEWGANESKQYYYKY